MTRPPTNENILQQQLPHDNEAEKKVLGAVLYEPECLHRVHLSTSSFFFDYHQTIWRAIMSVNFNGENITPASVADHLRTRKMLEKVGGTAYIENLCDECPSAVNVHIDVRIVARAAMHRKRIKAGQQLINRGFRQDDWDQQELDDLLADSAPPRPAFTFDPINPDYITEDPPPRRWLLRSKNNEGFLPRGKVGVLSAEGGTGKTSALVGLGIAVTAETQWLETWNVDEGGSALLLLGEEDAEEVHRRIRRYARTHGLSPRQVERVTEKLCVKPLAGIPFPLINDDGSASENMRALKNAVPDDCALIVIDPLSRFAAGETESENTVATRVVQAFESLALLQAAPTVLIATHSSKQSRREGKVDVRGVTGLTDAARWVCTMKKLKTNDGVEINVPKTNYTIPAKPVTLKWRDNVLRPLAEEEQNQSDAEFEAMHEAILEKRITMLVEALTKHGPLTSRAAIAKAANIRAADAKLPLDIAINRKLIIQDGKARTTTYRAQKH